jgi:hypothetical protein
MHLIVPNDESFRLVNSAWIPVTGTFPLFTTVMFSTPLGAPVGMVRLASTATKVPVELLVVEVFIDWVTVVTTVRVKIRVRTVVTV